MQTKSRPFFPCPITRWSTVPEAVRGPGYPNGSLYKPGNLIALCRRCAGSIRVGAASGECGSNGRCGATDKAEGKGRVGLPVRETVEEQDVPGAVVRLTGGWSHPRGERRRRRGPETR
jgi:hypothetical protein